MVAPLRGKRRYRIQKHRLSNYLHLFPALYFFFVGARETFCSFCESYTHNILDLVLKLQSLPKTQLSINMSINLQVSTIPDLNIAENAEAKLQFIPAKIKTEFTEPLNLSNFFNNYTVIENDGKSTCQPS